MFKGKISLKVVIVVFVLAVLLSSVFAAEKPAPANEKPEIFAQLGHSGQVQSAAFSPDGKYLASGSGDKTVKVWDVETGREIRTLVTNTDINRIAFGSDNRTLVSAGGATNDVILWDVMNGRKIRVMKMPGKHNYVDDVAFSSDGAIIAAASHIIQLFDAKTGRAIRTLRSGISNSNFNSIAFSPDRKYLASGSGNMNNNSKDNTVRLWDVTSGKEIFRFTGHVSDVHRVAFSPEGQYLASIGRDKQIILWDIKKGKAAKTLTGHTYEQGAISFSPDGRYIADADFYHLRLWDVSSGLAKMTFKDDKTDTGIMPNAVIFSPDGPYAAVSAGSAVSLWDTAIGRKIRAFGGNVEGMSDAFFSANESQIKIAGYGGVITFNRYHGYFTGLQKMTSRMDDRFLREFNEENYNIIDIKTDKIISSIPYADLSQDMKADMTYSPDGRQALISADNSIKIFDLRSNRQSATLENSSPDWKIRDKAIFSDDGKYVAGWPGATGDIPIVVLWDTKTGRQIMKQPQKNIIWKALLTADGKQLICATKYRVDVLNTLTGAAIRKFSGHSNEVGSLALSGDEKYLLSGDWDGEIKLWNFHTGKEIKTFTGHTNWVESVAFSRNNKYILSSSRDRTVRLWDIAAGSEIVQFISFTDGEWIVITPEGYYNASGGGDKHLNVRVGDNVYGVENYRESFFRPGLVEVALSGGTLKQFRNLADIKQPPAVRIVQTSTSSTTEDFKLTLQLQEQGGGIGEVRLFLNDSAVMLDNSRSLKVVSKAGSGEVYRSYTLRLSPGSNSIRAVAFNADNSMQSNAAVHQVSANFVSIRKPALHALVIGINEYKNPKLTLQYAVADARLFADTLQKSAAGLFENVVIKLLITREDTRAENIATELRALRNINPDDLFVLYVASHGVVDDGEYYLITSNVGLTRTEKLKTDALTQTALKELIANIPTTKKLIILDTCNAGAAGDAIQVAMLTRGMSDDTAMKILSRAVGSTILSAATSSQEAMEGYQGHGLFTWVLAEGLSGKADKGRSGYIKTTDIADYVGEEVPNLAEKVFKRAQYPTISISGQAFPIGKVK